MKKALMVLLVAFAIAGFVIAAPGPGKSKNKKVNECSWDSGNIHVDAVFLTTGSGVVQEWQARSDGTYKHIKFIPADRDTSEEECDGTIIASWNPTNPDSRYLNQEPAGCVMDNLPDTPYWVCIEDIEKD